MSSIPSAGDKPICRCQASIVACTFMGFSRAYITLPFGNQRYFVKKNKHVPKIVSTYEVLETLVIDAHRFPFETLNLLLSISDPTPSSRPGIFHGQYFLDIQDRVSHTSLHKKEVLINPQLI
jgi:hypothetical protein